MKRVKTTKNPSHWRGEFSGKADEDSDHSTLMLSSLIELPLFLVKLTRIMTAIIVSISP
jgi:hypothetical protein